MEIQISSKLENLKDNTLTRIIGSQIPEDKVLQSKLLIIETHLNKQKEKVLQNEIILEEIVQINKKFQLMATSNRKDNLELMEVSNKLKNKYNKVVRKLMTLVSELSLY